MARRKGVGRVLAAVVVAAGAALGALGVRAVTGDDTQENITATESGDPNSAGADAQIPTTNYTVDQNGVVAPVTTSAQSATEAIVIEYAPIDTDGEWKSYAVVNTFPSDYNTAFTAFSIAIANERGRHQVDPNKEFQDGLVVITDQKVRTTGNISAVGYVIFINDASGQKPEDIIMSITGGLGFSAETKLVLVTMPEIASCDLPDLEKIKRDWAGQIPGAKVTGASVETARGELGCPSPS
jgi:predicted RNA-binding protein with TRAM domain